MSKIPDVFTGPCPNAMLGTVLPINAPCHLVAQALLPVCCCDAAILPILAFARTRIRERQRRRLKPTPLRTRAL
jgi:hypothetical protein